MFAAGERRGDRGGLGGVAERRRRRVRVDVADVVEGEVRPVQRLDHGGERAGAVGPRRRRVVRVRREPEAPDLRVDPRAAGRRGLQVLEHEHGGALGEHKARAGLVEGPRRPRRVARVATERAQPREARDGRLVDGRLRAAAEHHVRAARLDQAVGLADGHGAGGAGRGGRRQRAAAAVVDRDRARGHVREEPRHEVGRQLPARREGRRGADRVAEGADARRDADAAPLRRDGQRGRARVGDGLGGRGDREVDEAAPVARAGDRRGLVRRRREVLPAAEGQAPRVRRAGEDAGPGLRSRGADGRDAADAGHHDAPQGARRRRGCQSHFWWLGTRFGVGSAAQSVDSMLVAISRTTGSANPRLWVAQARY